MLVLIPTEINKISLGQMENVNLINDHVDHIENSPKKTNLFVSETLFSIYGRSFRIEW